MNSLSASDPTARTWTVSKSTTEVYLLGGARCVFPHPHSHFYSANELFPSRQIAPPVPHHVIDNNTVISHGVVRRFHRPKPPSPHTPSLFEIEAERPPAASPVALSCSPTFTSSNETSTMPKNWPRTCGNACPWPLPSTFISKACGLSLLSQVPMASTLGLILSTHPITPSPGGRYRAYGVNSCTADLIT